MRVLVAGSNLFGQHYRVERALVKASKGHEDFEVVVMTDPDRPSRTRPGGDRLARSVSEEAGWDFRRVTRLADARADICIALLNRLDTKDEPARITAYKAEKAGLPVWRFYQ